MRGPHALLLDLDGTLADSLGVMRAVFARFLAEHGGRCGPADFERFNGPPLEAIVATLRQELGLTDSVEALLARYNRIIDEAYAEIRPTQGAAGLLDAAREAGWLVAIVTSNNRARTEAWLERTGLGPLVRHVVCGEDVRCGKPSPDPYLRGLAALGVTAGAARAVEDSAQGAASALAAGVVTFGYQPPDRPCPAWPAGIRPVTSFAELSRLLFARTAGGVIVGT